MKYIIFALLCTANTIFAQPSYTTYDAFLQKYVTTSGKVSYKKIKKAELNTIATQLQTAAPQKTWTKNDQLAYWMNVYNVFTIKLITDNYPVTSITKLDNGKPWDVKRIEIGGKKYSLNDIENEIIRPTFKDARIHFGINCAAKSCPPLHNKAFTTANVQALLTQRTKAFMVSKSNTLSPNAVKISKIFDWYKADFQDLSGFLTTYSTIKVAKDAKIEYADYDWSLNE